MKRCLPFIFSIVASAALAADLQPSKDAGPYVPSPQSVVSDMLRYAEVGADDFLIDLGSGDGRIVIAAARRFGARGLGIELDEALVRTSRENARRAGVADRASFAQGDVLTADFSAATVVTLYLLPELIGRLQPRFLTDLKPGTRVVSHAFRMTGWRPDASQTLQVAGPHPGQGDESTLYLWIVPAAVRGVWAGGGMRVRIEQNYQEIDVEGATEATLRGADIAWRSPAGRFSGRVEGDRIIGDDTRVLARER